MKKWFKYSIYIAGLILCSCSSNIDTVSEIDFLSTSGVSEYDTSLGLYSYNDTLYYYDPTTKMLFKVPTGFEANNQNTYWGSGLRLTNPDSSIIIYLDSFKGGWEELIDDPENDFYSWWGYCWDNTDVKTSVEESKYGYTKIGFAKKAETTFKPIYEKCVMYHDVDSGWRPHLIRIEYPDSLAQDVAWIIWNYVEPYPNIFYPKLLEK